MNKIWKVFLPIFVFVFIGIVFFAILFSSSETSEQIDDKSGEYVITNYVVTATYKQDNTMVVSEEISVHFNTAKHGIYRALPEENKVHLGDFNKNLRSIYNLTYANTESAVESADNIYYIKLGSESYYYGTSESNKNKTFKFSYDVQLDSRYPQIEAFYYNVLGHLWDTDVQNFSATINFEQEILNPNTQIFVGKSNSTETLSSFVWTNNKTLTLSSTSTLHSGEGITILCNMPESYATAQTTHLQTIVVLVAIFVMLFVLLLVYFACSNKKRITPVVQFAVDKKYTPADVGYIADKKVNNCDIASLIIYWAEKGFLTIEEKGKDTFLKLTEKTFTGKAYEKQLFFAIFDKQKPGEEVSVKSIGVSISEEVADVKKSVATENENMFKKNAISWRGFVVVMIGVVQGFALWFANYFQVNDLLQILSIVVGIATVVGLFAICSSADKKHISSKNNKIGFAIFVIILLGCELVFSILSFASDCDTLFTVFFAFGLVCVASFVLWKFNARSDEGCETLGDIVGLKNFIEVAEKSRLEMLVKSDPQAFYKILPYAYVLGVYDTWCKKFEDIIIDAPAFYASDDAVFNVIVFSNMMRITNSSILSAFTKANMHNAMQNLNKSSSDYTGGGGFSGGGIGGGGGGSW